MCGHRPSWPAASWILLFLPPSLEWVSLQNLSVPAWQKHLLCNRPHIVQLTFPALLYFISYWVLQQPQQHNPWNLFYPWGWSEGFFPWLYVGLFGVLAALFRCSGSLGDSTWPHTPLCRFYCLEAASNLHMQGPCWLGMQDLPSVQTSARWMSLAVVG